MREMDEATEAAPNAFAALSALADTAIQAAAESGLTWAEVAAAVGAEAPTAQR